jgi:hypothetical protein
MDAAITNPEANNCPALEERLELGEVHLLTPPLPFSLPSADDQAFLREQELHRGKEIVFEPAGNRLAGFRRHAPDQSQRVRRILEQCHQGAAHWLKEALPRYAGHARLVRTCFHVAEEATRCLRVTARNDLLHIDALHSSDGCRILRLFVNLNPVDARVWASSEPLVKVLPRLGPLSGLVDASGRWPARLGHEMLRLFRPDRTAVEPYDEFMLSFTRYLKHSDEFQDKAPRKIWRFAPGQAWVAFTDSLVHADLRGRWVLDHLFLLPPECCMRTDLNPSVLLAHLGLAPRRAA